MTIQNPFITFLISRLKFGSVAIILAGLLSVSSLASAATDTKKPATPAPKAAAKPAAKPAGSAGGAAKTGAAAGAKTSTGPSANKSTGPSANKPNTPTANSHPTRPGGSGPANAAHGPAGGANKAFGGHPTPAGSHDRTLRSGSAVRTDRSGHVRDVHDARRGMDVHHGLGGGRRVSVERADHSRLVAERGRRGYIERPYGFHGHDFGRRSYYYHGRAYDRFYRGYGYRGEIGRAHV